MQPYQEFAADAEGASARDTLDGGILQMCEARKEESRNKKAR